MKTAKELVEALLRRRAWSALDAGITRFGNAGDVAQIFYEASRPPAASARKPKAQ